MIKTDYNSAGTYKGSQRLNRVSASKNKSVKSEKSRRVDTAEISRDGYSNKKVENFDGFASSLNSFAFDEKNTANSGKAFVEKRMNEGITAGIVVGGVVGTVIVPGVGTCIGAAVGAGLGAIVGGIYGGVEESIN